MKKDIETINKELKETERISGEIYDEYVDLVFKSINKEGGSNIINKQLKELEKQLDFYDEKEDELHNEIKELYKKEYVNKSNKLIIEYGDNKYKAIYDKGKIEYYKHRKDINLDNLMTVYQINKQEGKLPEEYTAFCKDDNCVTHIFYNDNHINDVKELIRYNKDKVEVRRVYRNGFRYEKYSYSIMFMEFDIKENLSVKYIKNRIHKDTEIYINSGSKSIPVKILDVKYTNKIKEKIKQLQKDKYVGIEDMLREFNIYDNYL